MDSASADFVVVGHAGTIKLTVPGGSDASLHFKQDLREECTGESGIHWRFELSNPSAARHSVVRQFRILSNWQIGDSPCCE